MGYPSNMTSIPFSSLSFSLSPPLHLKKYISLDHTGIIYNERWLWLLTIYIPSCSQFYLAVSYVWALCSVFCVYASPQQNPFLTFPCLSAELQSQSMAHLCVVQEAIKGSFLWTSEGGGRKKWSLFWWFLCVAQQFTDLWCHESQHLNPFLSLPSAATSACQSDSMEAKDSHVSRSEPLNMTVGLWLNTAVTAA